ncbi:hypothetical protein CIHG_00384 [Coccidioides immitis H538.4]|uniref:Uncharacterized protein n=3 Tax=Coccidioides immitis TaxID=5501 RepID=A0A0J8TEP5_COCIT|nr:hypothetical protein CIRG_07203 [Coccidioides immitis RMSCC 2394]KMU72027.1 hypothetical protein CISG_00336 [Coccidioides immitis RMSCC 3703]KMU82603.1 hypothetical protein CIHG_00384 [Coccidioides immitis H538.4]
MAEPVDFLEPTEPPAHVSRPSREIRGLLSGLCLPDARSQAAQPDAADDPPRYLGSHERGGSYGKAMRGKLDGIVFHLRLWVILVFAATRTHLLPERVTRADSRGGRSPD